MVYHTFLAPSLCCVYVVPTYLLSLNVGLHKAGSRHSLQDVLLISLCFDMFPGAVCRLMAEAGVSFTALCYTQGLWGTAHTWKHFRASLHCNWAYYHNYSFKAPAICIRHAPAQPAGLWPCGAAGSAVSLCMHSLLLLSIFLLWSLSSFLHLLWLHQYQGIIQEFIMFESVWQFYGPAPKVGWRR